MASEEASQRSVAQPTYGCSHWAAKQQVEYGSFVTNLARGRLKISSQKGMIGRSGVKRRAGRQGPELIAESIARSSHLRRRVLAGAESHAWLHGERGQVALVGFVPRELDAQAVGDVDGRP
eukprot:6190383-Pleurochrysis_carterae.AAC.1